MLLVCAVYAELIHISATVLVHPSRLHIAHHKQHTSPHHKNPIDHHITARALSKTERVARTIALDATEAERQSSINQQQSPLHHHWPPTPTHVRQERENTNTRRCSRVQNPLAAWCALRDRAPLLNDRLRARQNPNQYSLNRRTGDTTTCTHVSRESPC